MSEKNVTPDAALDKTPGDSVLITQGTNDNPIADNDSIMSIKENQDEGDKKAVEAEAQAADSPAKETGA